MRRWSGTSVTEFRRVRQAQTEAWAGRFERWVEPFLSQNLERARAQSANAAGRLMREVASCGSRRRISRVSRFPRP